MKTLIQQTAEEMAILCFGETIKELAPEEYNKAKKIIQSKLEEFADLVKQDDWYNKMKKEYRKSGIRIAKLYIKKQKKNENT